MASNRNLQRPLPPVPYSITGIDKTTRREDLTKINLSFAIAKIIYCSYRVTQWTEVEGRNLHKNTCITTLSTNLHGLEIIKAQEGACIPWGSAMRFSSPSSTLRSIGHRDQV